MKKSKKNNKQRVYKIIVFTFVLSILCVILKCTAFESQKESSDYNELNVNTIIGDFAKNHNLKTDAWPEKLVDLLEKNPETREFVLNYPIGKDMNYKIDLSEHKNSKKVPLLMQWDQRWGYNQYAGGLMGLTGCGPTCLSMVCIYLLNNVEYTPKYIAEYSERNGYCVSGNGSSWSLISKGGKELGLDVVEIPLDDNRIIKNLKVGNPIICIMGPGDFTSAGHFIVMTEYVDGKIKVNDPNSKARSDKLWNLSDIKSQIRNLWVCRV